MAKKRKKKSGFPKKYRCTAAGFVYWKNERMTAGSIITVTAEDWKNKGLRNKLQRAFEPVQTATIVSGPIEILK